MKSLLLCSFGFLGIFFGQSQAVANLLMAGQFHSCAWDGGSDSSIVCWGLGDDGLTSPDPFVKNIKQMTSGDWHSCAIYEKDRVNKIYCWGINDFHQLDHPDDPNPVFLALGKTHSCGVFQGDTGLYVKCWGGTASESGITEYPMMKEVKGLYSGKGYSCAFHDEFLSCWGSVNGKWKVSEQPTLKEVSAGMDLQCHATRKSKVPTCWTNTDRRVSYQNSFQKCTLDLGQVPSCLKTDSSVPFTVDFQRPLVNPRNLAVGLWHICVLDDIGIECGGSDNSEEQISVPYEKLVFGPFFSSFDTSMTFLNMLKDFVYDFDGQFISGILRLGDGSQNRFLMALLQGYVEDLRYPYLKESFLREAVKNIGLSMLQESIEGVSSFYGNDEFRQTAFSVLLYSIRTARSLYSNKVQSEIEVIERELVQAMARSDVGDALADKIGYFTQCHTSLNPYLSARNTVESAVLEFLKRGSGVKQHVCK